MSFHNQLVKLVECQTAMQEMFQSSWIRAINKLLQALSSASSMSYSQQGTLKNPCTCLKEQGTEFPVQGSGLVMQVGASHRVTTPLHLFPPWTELSKKNEYKYEYEQFKCMMTLFQYNYQHPSLVCCFLVQIRTIVY